MEKNTENNISEPAVIVRSVTKSFKIPLEGSTGLKQKLVNAFKNKKGYRQFTPLNDISFTVEKGDFFGIVGKNGSGKSTLLKTIAEIYQPDKGTVKVNGSLVPFIELGVGFNPELTGRENVYLNGALLGFSRKEVMALYDEIVEFAELEEFMEERLKNYSSGMQVRLAFSIAIKAKGDILLLDEVLAVGDAAFQQKCFNYFEQLKKDKKTIIIVTHDMGAVKRFCNKALIIRNGNIEKIGKPQDIADIYTEENIEQQVGEGMQIQPETKLKLSIPKKRYNADEKITAKIEYNPIKGVSTFVNVSILRDGNVIADLNTKYKEYLNNPNGKNKISFSQNLNKFNPGTYEFYVTLHRTDDDLLIQQIPHAATFFLEGYDPSRGGSMKLDDEWFDKN